MAFRLVDKGWGQELEKALSADAGALRIVCPFINDGALKRLVRDSHPRRIQVITRFNLVDFAQGVSDTAALRRLVNARAQVRGVRNLHAKLFLFGYSIVIATSANLTKSALSRNHEFGFVSDDAGVVKQCRAYFEALWLLSGADLVTARIDAWDAKVTRHLASGGGPRIASGLGDEGVDAGFPPEPPTPPLLAAEAGHAFVKFLGEASNRAPLMLPILDELRRAGCHWAVAYPNGKRPRAVRDGAVIFIARITKEPNDIRVFGRATGLQHVPGRDDATPDDIKLRKWKLQWPHYIRVHNAEFVAGTMGNGISLYEMMDALAANAFMATQRNAAKGAGNTDPRRAYQQQPAVELTGEGLAWLSVRLDAAFSLHGKTPASELQQLDWPSPPP